jgi:hypothetical protein
VHESPYFVLEPYLERGEPFVWAGRPRPASRWELGCGLVAFTALLFGCLTWTIYPWIQEEYVRGAHVRLFGIGTVSSSVILVFVGVSAPGNRARNTYGLTGRRALILPWQEGAEVISVPLQGQRGITRKEHRNGTGTITFCDPGEVWWSVGTSEDEMTKTAFEMVDNARLVYELINEARVRLANPPTI